jgi:hypothetical protein
MYIEKGSRYGTGSTYYLADNPDFGATFTYYVNEVPKTLKQERKEAERELIEEKAPIPIPTMEELRAEENEVAPHLIFTIYDAEGNEVRKLYKSASKGMNRITWNLRYAGTRPVSLKNDKFSPTASQGDSWMVMPGNYFVSMDMYHRGETTQLVEPVPFTVEVLNNTTLPAEDREDLVAFQKEISDVARIVDASERAAEDMLTNIRKIKQTLYKTPDAPPSLLEKVNKIEMELDEVMWAFNGQEPKASSEENWPAPPTINERIWAIMVPHWSSTSAVTQTQRDQLELLEEEFPPVYDKIKKIMEDDMPKIEAELDKLGAAWTPGRLPEWNR